MIFFGWVWILVSQLVSQIVCLLGWHCPIDLLVKFFIQFCEFNFWSCFALFFFGSHVLFSFYVCWHRKAEKVNFSDWLLPLTNCICARNLSFSWVSFSRFLFRHCFVTIMFRLFCHMRFIFLYFIFFCGLKPKRRVVRSRIHAALRLFLSEWHHLLRF